MVLRDQGCRADGCDRPPSWTEAHHHTKPWAEGGTTNLADGILLCGHHHRLAHHPDYTTERLPNGDLRYHRRTSGGRRGPVVVGGSVRCRQGRICGVVWTVVPSGVDSASSPARRSWGSE
jgi:hypothetical protein